MRRLHGMPLALAITLTLIAKILILMALHKAFFSAPMVKKMRMPLEKIEQHLLSPSPPPKAQP
ncbi:MAG: hypothetical protein Q7S67_00065 [Telluria sp.]|nr:hypothetical protein [Telluria sp.]